MAQSVAQHNVRPHSFKPLRPWDALRGGGRCRACFLPRNAHPIHYWAPARPWGDKRKAELSFEALSGKWDPVSQIEDNFAAREGDAEYEGPIFGGPSR